MKAFLSPLACNNNGKPLDDFGPYCTPLGIYHEQWPVHGLDNDLCVQIAENPGLAEPLMSQVLQAVHGPLAALKQSRGYTAEDIVCLSAHTLQLNDILAMFDKEHHHTDDEVRVVLTGGGVFGIVPPAETGLPPFELHVETGDMIVVPAFTRHWFTLDTLTPKADFLPSPIGRGEQLIKDELPYIVALRVFKDKSGWVAHYES